MSPQQPKVSVIIPVYKVEPYIEKCVRSLFQQTLKEMEFIFVDDCSPDNSIAVMNRVLEEFPQRLNQVKIFSHEINRGVGASRQDGVDIATGEYIIHCDPDDWIDIDLYQSLYGKALQDKADVVICGYIDECDDERKINNIKITTDNPIDFLETVYLEHNEAYLWNKLIKKEIYQFSDIQKASDLSLWEDMYILTALLINSQKISVINTSAYHYRRNNPSSIVNSITTEKIDSQIRAVQKITDVIKEKEYDILLKEPLNYLKLRAKSNLLANPLTYDTRKWYNTFPEANPSIRKFQTSKLRKFIMLTTSKKIYLFADIMNWIRKKIYTYN